MSADLPSQIHSELSGLDTTNQRRVLDFVRTLKQTSKEQTSKEQTPKGVLGAKLKGLAGTLSEAEAQSMIEAIQAGCEQVDPDRW